MKSPELGYYLGGHAWAVREWIGSFLPKGTSPSRLLGEYSRRFNCVEGNNTFYGLPRQETFEKWMDMAAPGFRFCFKFPQQISHIHMLEACERECEAFLDLVHQAQERGHAGPAFLQLGPRFGDTHFARLERFLTRLPRTLRYAVELRHPDFFDEGATEGRVDQLLDSLNMARCVFDTRALYAKPPADEHERKAQTKKPKVPLRQTMTADTPFVRLVGRNRMEDNGIWLQDWVPVLAQWIAEGKRPYVFVHAPDDRVFPEQCIAFHNALRKACPQVSPLPTFSEEVLSQQDLF